MSEHKRFPNLARRHESTPEDFPEVQETIERELSLAGIKFKLGESRLDHGEVPYNGIGTSNRWVFSRNWYYWVAKGPGIPPTFANEFDQQWGREARAEGDAGCSGSLALNGGFATSLYHIDTQEALNAFVCLLSRVNTPSPEQVGK